MGNTIIGSIWNIILATVGTKVDLDELKSAIGEKDLEHISELLEIVKTSGCHLELWRRQQVSIISHSAGAKIKKKTRRCHS